LIGLTAGLSLYAFYEVGICGKVVHIQFGKWMDSELFSINWGFLFDSLTVVMLVVVTVVSTLVHLYSGEYMAGDPHRPRFMSYLSFFTFCMLLLVTADNYLQMFLGWELVGVSSYLLINFWYTRIQANKAAIQAMLVNRMGDFALALGIMGIFAEFKSIDYATVFAAAPTISTNENMYYGFAPLNIIGILLFIGAVGKSAQIGLHIWLPNAMEGPTPVSALIHAATMVTAGVFLLARSSPLLEYAPEALEVVSVMGALTAFFAATSGLLQNDLKKVIAYSTCSQLGYMVFACGLSAYNVGVFHLANHAFFKALLFLSAGSVIHAMSDEQDLRRMGGLVKVLPFTYAMIFIGSLALMGFPFLSGFYSKDVILEVAYAKDSLAGHGANWLGSLAAFFTAFYSIRLIHLTFLSKAAGHNAVYRNSHEGSWVMGLPLLLLSIGSIWVGFLTKDLLIGLGTDFWANAIFTHPANLVMVDAEFLPHSIKLIPIVFSLTGAISALILYSFFADTLYSLKRNNSGLYTFGNRKWLFDKVYAEWIIQPVFNHAYSSTYLTVDRGLLEVLGPYGIGKALYSHALSISHFQSGHWYHYTLVILVAIGAFLGFMFFGTSYLISSLLLPVLSAFLWICLN
jgi:NADH-ubiquinone oxidoreductase chain 5